MKSCKKKHKGTRVVKKYAIGGVTGDPKNVEELLARLNAFGVDDSDVVQTLPSLVSENTQPHGYTAPVVPGVTDNNPLIRKIDPPRVDRLSEFDELEKADWSTILANPMQAWKYISKNGFTRPTQAELDAQGSNIYDGVMSMFNPFAYVEAVKGLDSSLTAADEALLSGIEDGSLSPGDISNVVGNLSDASMQALFLSMAPMGGRTLLGAAKELRRPVFRSQRVVNLELNAENVYSVLPEAQTQIKDLAKNYVERNSTPSTIELADATKLTNVALKEVEYTNILKSSIASTNATLGNQVAKKVITPAQEAQAKAETKLFYEEKFKQEGFMENLIKSQEASNRINPTKQKGVEQFGYVEIAQDGTPDIIAFDTPELAALKLYEMLTAPEGHDVLERAVLITQEQMNREHGMNWRGFYAPARDAQGMGFIDLKQTDWTRAYTEAEMGVLNTLSPKELLKTLVHERDHVMRVPFMKYLMDNWALTENTLLSDVRRTAGIEGKDVLGGQIKVGTKLHDIHKTMGLTRKMEEDLLYALDPAEMGEKISEIQQTWWRTEQGKNMSDWAYKWDAKMAQEAYDLWDNGNRNVMILLMKGANEKEKFQSLADLMNNMLAPVATIVGTGAAVEAVADPQVGATKYNTGGFVVNKKRPRGMNIKRLR